MALESLENRIDIHRLNIEAPQPEAPGFDAEKEIDEYVWDQLNQLLDSLTKQLGDGLEKYVLPLAANMRLLFPNRGIHLNIPMIDDEVWTKVDAYIEAVLKPENREESPSRLQVDHERLEDHLADFVDEGDWSGYLKHRYKMEILFPQPRRLHNANWKWIKDYLQNSKDRHELAIAKLLFPDNFEEIKIGQADWHSWRKDFKWPRTPDLFPSAVIAQLELALDLKILSAKEAKITEQGIETVDSDQEFSTQVGPNLPEQRKF